MDQPKPIDREAVKTLAIAVGLSEAARRMGLNPDRVRQWSSRGKWFKDQPKPLTVHTQNGSIVTGVTKSPSVALADTLKARHSTTKLNLSKYCINGSMVAAKSRKPLSDAPLVDKLASVMTKVWPEQQVQSAGPFSPASIQVLSQRTYLKVN